MKRKTKTMAPAATLSGVLASIQKFQSLARASLAGTLSVADRAELARLGEILLPQRVRGRRRQADPVGVPVVRRGWISIRGRARPVRVRRLGPWSAEVLTRVRIPTRQPLAMAIEAPGEELYGFTARVERIRNGGRVVRLSLRVFPDPGLTGVSTTSAHVRHPEAGGVT